MKILMVCLGNICRSPLADGLLRHKVQRDGISATVDSAGTANYHTGGPPDERMTATALQNGIDLSSLRARQFEVSDFDSFDLIYVMDKSNYHNVTRLARDEKDVQKVKLILDELGVGAVCCMAFNELIEDVLGDDLMANFPLFNAISNFPLAIILFWVRNAVDLGYHFQEVVHEHDASLLGRF